MEAEMPRIANVDQLKKMRDEARMKRAKLVSEKVIVNVSLATCGIASGGEKVMAAMQAEVKKQGLGNVVFLTTGCMTYCHSEPTVQVCLPGKKPVVFGKLDEVSARRLVENYIVKGEPVGTVIPVNYVRVTL